MSIVSLFCEIHDFFMMYETHLATQCLSSQMPPERRGHRRNLHASEVMTIVIAFHENNYRTLKHFYEKHVCIYWSSAFPNLVSYARFVQLQQEVLGPLTLYLYSRLGVCSGISFIDSTPLPVCDNRRISRHRVFKGAAKRAKNSMGWFYGFKLHLVINDTGELLSFSFTPANTDDRHRVATLVSTGIFGNLYADRGYISKDLRDLLSKQGNLNLVYKVRKNMKPLPLSVSDEVLLKKRVLIESVIKELKTQTQLAHTRHRSLINFQVNAISALIAYTYLLKKPTLKLYKLQEIKDLPLSFNF